MCYKNLLTADRLPKTKTAPTVFMVKQLFLDT